MKRLAQLDFTSAAVKMKLCYTFMSFTMPLTSAAAAVKDVAFYVHAAAKDKVLSHVHELYSACSSLAMV